MKDKDLEDILLEAAVNGHPLEVTLNGVEEENVAYDVTEDCREDDEDVAVTEVEEALIKTSLN